VLLTEMRRRRSVGDGSTAMTFQVTELLAKKEIGADNHRIGV